MKAINFVVCLCMAFMLSTFNSLAAGEDFKSFLHKFTSSASFQYSRIKFPTSKSSFWGFFFFIGLFFTSSHFEVTKSV